MEIETILGTDRGTQTDEFLVNSKRPLTQSIDFLQLSHFCSTCFKVFFPNCFKVIFPMCFKVFFTKCFKLIYPKYSSFIECHPSHHNLPQFTNGIKVFSFFVIDDLLLQATFSKHAAKFSESICQLSETLTSWHFVFFSENCPFIQLF